MEKEMPHPLQEKFQITVPAKIEGDEPWASFESARDTHGKQEWCPADAGDQDPNKFNYMPPGMDIHQHCSLQPQMPLSMAGQTDVSVDTNPDSFDCGFKKREMKGTDDQYTGEHVDHFYGDAGGFVERNNYLDRE
jgi:hypothetical protein